MLLLFCLLPLVDGDQFDGEDEGGAAGDAGLRELREQREQSRICSDYAESRTKKTAGQKAGDAIGDIVKHAKIIGDTLGKIVVYLKT